MIRVEFTDPSYSNWIYIVNGATKQFWISTNGEWADLSSVYASQYATWFGIYNTYKDNLASWAGFGDYTYTAPDGSSVRIYDISVNPTLPDSLFQHSETTRHGEFSVDKFLLETAILIFSFYMKR